MSGPGDRAARGGPAAPTPGDRAAGRGGMMGMGMGLPPAKARDFGGSLRRLLGCCGRSAGWSCSSSCWRSSA